MNACDSHTENLALTQWVWLDPSDSQTLLPIAAKPSAYPKARRWSIDVFRPLRLWLDSIPVHNPNFAHKICQLIPAQCPFERDVKVFGYVLCHIPPLCKLNPVYDQVVALRFRALCYLADECGEDITPYC
jgi:hypothetical protein